MVAKHLPVVGSEDHIRIAADIAEQFLGRSQQTEQLIVDVIDQAIVSGLRGAQRLTLKLYVVRVDGETSSLQELDLSGNTRTLRESPEAPMMCAVAASPDGRHLAMGHVSLDNDVWLIENP